MSEHSFGSTEKFSRLLHRLRNDARDEGAWRQFIEGISPRIIRYVYVRSGNLELARDIVQDVLLQFVKQRGIETITSEGGALALLRRMAKNRLIDWHRSARRSPMTALDERSSMVVDPSAPDPSESPRWREVELKRLSAHLNEGDRQLLSLVTGGNGVRAAAEALGIPYSTAGVRIFRLKERLRRLAEMTLRKKM